MAKDVKAGGAYVEIGAKYEKAKKAFAAIEKSLQKVGKQMAKVGAKIAGVGTAISGSMLLVAKSFAAFGDSIEKTSARLGIGTQALSEYHHVAKMSGVQTSNLDMAWQRMTRRVSEAAQGTGEAKNAINELGLSAKHLNQLSLDKQFEMIASAIHGVTNQADRVRLSMRFFDSEGVKVVQMINLGVDGMKAYRRQARELGVTLDEDATESAVRFANSMRLISSALLGVKNSIAMVVLPSIQDMTLRITGILVQLRKWIEVNPQVIHGLFRIGKVLLAVGTTMSAFGAVLFAAMNPLLILIGAISIAVLSILESFGVVNIGINSGLKSLFSDFAIFGKSLEDWGKMLGLTLEVVFWSLFESVIQGVEWVTKRVESKLEWLEERFARFFDWLLGVDKETSDAAAIARKNGGDNTASDTLARLRENLTAKRDEAARDALRFDIESSERGKDLPSFSKFADKMKEILNFKFKPIDIPKITGIGETGGSLLPDKKSIVGFFGGAGSASEILGGAARSNDEQQLSEARKQTSLLDRIATNTKGGAATYA